jgi:hypothetical protein
MDFSCQLHDRAALTQGKISGAACTHQQIRLESSRAELKRVETDSLRRGRDYLTYYSELARERAHTSTLVASPVPRALPNQGS